MSVMNLIDATLADIETRARADIREVPHFATTRMQDGVASAYINGVKVSCVASSGSVIKTFWTVGGNRVARKKIPAMLVAARVAAE